MRARGLAFMSCRAPFELREKKFRSGVVRTRYCVRDEGTRDEYVSHEIRWYENGRKWVESSGAGTIAYRISAWFDDGNKESDAGEGRYLTWYYGGQRNTECFEDGLCTEWYENGTTESVHAFAVARHDDGVRGDWYANGRAQRRVMFRNGVPNGPAAAWYENGQKEHEATYIAGHMNGRFVRWYPNGRKRVEATYENGKRISATAWGRDRRVLDDRDRDLAIMGRARECQRRAARRVCSRVHLG